MVAVHSPELSIAAEIRGAIALRFSIARAQALSTHVPRTAAR